MVYNASGQLISNKTIHNGAGVSKTSEPMVLTDKGNFIFFGTINPTTIPSLTKGILFFTDPDLNILSSKLYGGNNSVSGSSVIKINSDKYLLLYLDSGFGAEGGKPRLVLRYMDSQGDFIE